MDHGFSPQTSGEQYKIQQEPRELRRDGDGAQPEKTESYFTISQFRSFFLFGEDQGPPRFLLAHLHNAAFVEEVADPPKDPDEQQPEPRRSVVFGSRRAYFTLNEVVLL